MKNYAKAIVVCAALTMASSALAEAHEEEGAMPSPHFEFEGTLSGVSVVGGVGGEVFGASWTETLSVGDGDGGVTVTSQCAGMDQPEGSLFDRHFTCTQSTEDGSSGAVLFGCNVENDEGNEMSCYGYFEGKSGAVEGHVSLETAYYWMNPDGTGRVVGSGQWIR
ncbi:hypothetical protein [uncultured Erythrobacter sp.]|uniref:hypothetical protein n=1 Tax=uncultured Erythrobacter sp. TaxID=263913 RepID=UPI0026034DB9|nr:hypothetical protein [uncultured Erythrobacter sp.]